MSYARRVTVTPVCDANGAATSYSDVVTGSIVTVAYAKAASNNYSNGVGATITVEGTGESVLTLTNMNATASYGPRQATHTTAGVASLFAAGGSAVLAPIVVAQDRIKIVIASGGNATTGTFSVLLQ
jgi:hypothetical protein